MTTTTSTTTSWRDTLSLWRGEILIIQDLPRDSRVEWIGKRMNVPGHSADARCCPTPIDRAFSDSQINFSLQGVTASVPKVESSSLIKVSITEGGWDYAGEETSEGAITTKRKRESSYQDSLHELSLPRGRIGLVVGKGQNTFGSFIEAGRLKYERNTDSTPKSLTLMRRYLQEGDERSTWSLTALRSQVQLGLPPLFSEGTSERVLDFARAGLSPAAGESSPWRCLALHSAVWRQRTMRDELGVLRKASPSGLSPELCGPAAPLAMPTLDGKYFRLHLNRRFSPNTTWESQCWGCGGPGVKEDLRFRIREWKNEQHNQYYPFGEYCSNECILQAVPELANCSAAWMEASAGADLFLGSNDQVFWDYLEGYEDVMQMMLDAGWEDTGWGCARWVLHAPGSDDSDGFDVDDYNFY
jgi:hypothetical protein